MASAFFLENWRLAADAVDYYADNSAASVAQHFWSLSVQGQFYVVAPLLVLLVYIERPHQRASFHCHAVSPFGAAAPSEPSVVTLLPSGTVAPWM